jgi:hypothetical protein
MITLSLLISLLLIGEAPDSIEVYEIPISPACLFEFGVSDNRADICTKEYLEILRSRGILKSRSGVRYANAYRMAVVEDRTFELRSAFIGDNIEFSVVSGGEVVAQFRESIRGAEEYFAFYGHNDEWILETWDHVFVNGVNIAERDSVDAVYYYTFLSGKPFYFFDNEGQTQVMTGTSVLPQTYDRILHHLCCGYSGLNPRQSKSSVVFIGIRDGEAYFVEIRAHSPH